MRKKIQLGLYKNKLQVLSFHCYYPNMNFCKYIETWKVHNKTENVQYLCMLNPQHVIHLPKGSLKIRQMSCVMFVVENIAKYKGSCFEVQNWTICRVERMIGSIEEDLGGYCENINDEKELSWKMVYKKWKK